MNREALIQLRRVVLEAPEELFNMHTFAEDLPCGTVRCAAGWAAVDPWFQTHCPISYKFAAGEWDKIRDVFDLSPKQADDLFGLTLPACTSDRYGNSLNDVSKTEVIRNIDRLLAGQPTRTYRAAR